MGKVKLWLGEVSDPDFLRFADSIRPQQIFDGLVQPPARKRLGYEALALDFQPGSTRSAF